MNHSLVDIMIEGLRHCTNMMAICTYPMQPKYHHTQKPRGLRHLHRFPWDEQDLSLVLGPSLVLQQ